jgi:hypothetical protein
MAFAPVLSCRAKPDTATSPAVLRTALAVLPGSPGPCPARPSVPAPTSTAGPGTPLPSCHFFAPVRVCRASLMRSLQEKPYPHRCTMSTPTATDFRAPVEDVWWRPAVIRVSVDDGGSPPKALSRLNADRWGVAERSARFGQARSVLLDALLRSGDACRRTRISLIPRPANQRRRAAGQGAPRRCPCGPGPAALSESLAAADMVLLLAREGGAGEDGDGGAPGSGLGL